MMDSPELDHVKCLSIGGDHVQSNTQCLCRSCNVAKSFVDAEEAMSMQDVDAMAV
ncbi:HNH endonuclease signature motif containing protein [Agrobacterium sp. DSM 25558]|uniref:HNH endonuclease n=1 Tax=Agrobacterium sp. DSM 25558 TaxID=1907665 RepID=UPI0009F87A56